MKTSVRLSYGTATSQEKYSFTFGGKVGETIGTFS